MSRGKLLVIDDDPDVGDLFGRIARRQGFDACVVTASEDFKTQCSCFDPDVILLDIFMPETDGFELLHYLGSHRCRAELILTSGKDRHFLSSAEQLAKAYGLTVLDKLSKPVHIEDLARPLDQAGCASSD